MPSCDGSNCGACSACSTRYVHLDKEERKEYEDRIAKLEQELKKQKKINKKIKNRLSDYEEDYER